MKQEKLIAFIAILFVAAGISGCASHADAETREQRVLAVVQPLIEEHFYRNGAVPAYDQIKRRAVANNSPHAPLESDQISIGQPKQLEFDSLFYSVPIEVKSGQGVYSNDVTMVLSRRAKDWHVASTIDDQGETTIIDDPANYACAIAEDLRGVYDPDGEPKSIDDLKAAIKAEGENGSFRCVEHKVDLEAFTGKADKSGITVQAKGSSEEFRFPLQNVVLYGVVKVGGGA